MTDPQKDEHIEELLSKLQGIFGKLSNAEEEEAQQKVDVPPAKAPEPKAPAADVKPAPTPPPVQFSAAAPMPNPDRVAALPKEIPLEPPPAAHSPAGSMPATSPTPSAPAAGSNPSGYDSLSPVSDPEKMIVPTAVFFPTGKEAEAKSLAMRLEMMTPKFTKVAFRLRVIVFSSYDPKSEWKELVLKKTSESACQTAFVVVDRPLDDARKKAITFECEANQIYFQDVPIGSIEKKAHYTDILLGLVFFFDSHKPPTSGETA